MKKFTSFVLLAAMMAALLSLSSCAKEPKEKEPENTAQPAAPTLYSITIDEMTNGAVSANKTSGIAEGETITLTITPEESDSYDCALVTLSVKNGDTDVNVNGTGNTRTFTMPAANVTVGATFCKTTYIGSKKPSVAKAVGDIVFNDGSAMPYTEFDVLDDDSKNDKKTFAIALIFYKGTELNNGNNTTTSRTLGVGLIHKNSIRWCKDANAFDKVITDIHCRPLNFTQGIFDGDKDGSDNLEQVGAWLKDENKGNTTDDTIGNGADSRYPAFYFAKNYKNKTIGSETKSRIAGTTYETGWYLPSLAELFQIYANGIGTNKVFDIDTASQALGGSKFTNTNAWYWSASVFSNKNSGIASIINFTENDWHGQGMDQSANTGYACAIRDFN